MGNIPNNLCGLSYEHPDENHLDNKYMITYLEMKKYLCKKGHYKKRKGSLCSRVANTFKLKTVTSKRLVSEYLKYLAVVVLLSEMEKENELEEWEMHHVPPCFISQI